MRTLYLTDEGAHVQKNGGRILVCKGAQILKDIPVENLESMVLFGSIQITARTITEFLQHGITLTWLSSRGEFFGRLESTRHVDIHKQRQQFRMGEKQDFCLAVAKNIIDAKVANGITLLRRYQRTADNPLVGQSISAMGILNRKLAASATTEQMLGVEGSAAQQYFKALAEIVHDDFRFPGRSRRPPRDPFNSLLSFGYTLLTYEIYTAIVNAGLHPYAGLLHKDRQGHPALASDLIEEWRAVIVDSLVMSMVQRREIQPDDFLPPADNGGVYLKRDAAKIFIAAYEKRMAKTNKYGEREMTFRQLLENQARLLGKALLSEDAELYRPIYIR
mgnify:FL=1